MLLVVGYYQRSGRKEMYPEIFPNHWLPSHTTFAAHGTTQCINKNHSFQNNDFKIDNVGF